jgi:3-methyladenine DNA glycosylase/8-oxoguanine DNA glycosylase
MPRATPAGALSPAAFLAGQDPVLAGLVERFGPIGPRRALPVPDRFGALCRLIVFQQLAGAAARAIWGRFAALLPDGVEPAGVLALDDAALAGSGLSRNKAAALRDLAAHLADGRVALTGRVPDDELCARLMAVRGIGRWTADLYLLSALGRPDVWPTGDYGVRVGFARAFGLDPVPTQRQLDLLGARFRPHRSTLARYCWLVADSPPAL